MTKQLQAVRGMNDVLPAQIGAWQFLEREFGGLLRDYGYEELRVPVVEHTELFQRSIGEHTDIVEKEMYTFKDTGGDSLTLRPEATAGIVRAVIANGLLRGARLKLWTCGPMFRHERPQQGRFRQFNQFSVEAIGFAGPDVDAELIALCARLWRRLGITRVRLLLNSLGSMASAPAVSERSADVLPGSRGGPGRGQPAAARGQSAAHPRQQGSLDAGADRGRAAAHRLPRCVIARALSPPCAPRSSRCRFRTRSIRVWCADSTTIRTRFLSGSPTRWVRRMPSAPAAATTV